MIYAALEGFLFLILQIDSQRVTLEMVLEMQKKTTAVYNETKWFLKSGRFLPFASLEVGPRISYFLVFGDISSSLYWEMKKPIFLSGNSPDKYTLSIWLTKANVSWQ